MSDQQYSLNLGSADEPALGLPGHSIKVPRNQKIKNLGLLGRKNLASAVVENEWNARAQQLIARYATEPRDLFSALATRFAQMESQDPEGAWDWQGWQQRFFQVLWYRRFLAHPMLFTCAEEIFSFPVSWTITPKNQNNDLFNALVAIKQARVTGGVRLRLGNCPAGVAWDLYQAFSASADQDLTKFPKPYPELQICLPAHHADLSQFLALRNSDRRQMRRVIAIEFPEGLVGREAIHEPLLREVHGVLRDGLDGLVLVFRNARESEHLVQRDPVCAGAINLAEFVDPGERRVLADELVGTLATSLRLVQDWRAACGEEHPIPWLGIVGFADAIERLELDYHSPEALHLARNFGRRLRRECRTACERLPAFQKVGHAPQLFAAGSRFFSQLGSAVPGFMAMDPDLPFRRSLEIQAAFADSQIATSSAMARKGGQLEPNDFLDLVFSAATQGWRALRFL